MSTRTPLLAAALATGTLTLAAAPAAATSLPGFGTAAVTEGRPGTGTPVDIRSVDVGRNDGYDRVVFTLSRPVAAFQVSYVPELVQEGSGETLPVAGGAVLEVILSPMNWSETPAPRVNTTPGYPGLRQVRLATDFEGYAQYGIGQATKAGFRVLRLDDPDRLVVDVAHPAAASAPTSSPPSSASDAPTRTTSAPTSAPASAPASASTSASTPAPASAASLSPAAAAGSADPGNGSPVPAIAIGATIALAAAGAVALALRLIRRPSL